VAFFFFFFNLSWHTTHTTRAERRARNSAGAEALAVARRPEEASREKNPAAAGIERFFSPERSSRRENNVRASIFRQGPLELARSSGGWTLYID